MTISYRKKNLSVHTCHGQRGDGRWGPVEDETGHQRGYDQTRQVNGPEDGVHSGQPVATWIKETQEFVVLDVKNKQKIF